MTDYTEAGGLLTGVRAAKRRVFAFSDRRATPRYENIRGRREFVGGMFIKFVVYTVSFVNRSTFRARIYCLLYASVPLKERTKTN